MATYATYRHVELDRVGCGKKRITKPPGGETSDVFTTSPGSSLAGTPPGTPRRVKNYMASTIFSEDGPVVDHALSSQMPRNTKHRPQDNSFSKLFGNGHFEDSIDGSVSPASTPRAANGIMNGTPKMNGNGLNGHHENGTNSGSSSGTATPIGDYANGMNGRHTPDSGLCTPRRVPPGGYSSKLW